MSDAYLSPEEITNIDQARNSVRRAAEEAAYYAKMEAAAGIEANNIDTTRAESYAEQRRAWEEVLESAKNRAVERDIGASESSVRDWVSDGASNGTNRATQYIEDHGLIDPERPNVRRPIRGGGRRGGGGTPPGLRALSILDIVGIPLMVASAIREQKLEEEQVERVLEADMAAIAEFLRGLGYEVEVDGTQLNISAGRNEPGTGFSGQMRAEHPRYGIINYYDVDIRVNEDGEVEGHVRYESTVEIAQATDIDAARYAAADVSSHDGPSSTPRGTRVSTKSGPDFA